MKPDVISLSKIKELNNEIIILENVTNLDSDMD